MQKSEKVFLVTYHLYSKIYSRSCSGAFDHITWSLSADREIQLSDICWHSENYGSYIVFFPSMAACILSLPNPWYPHTLSTCHLSTIFSGSKTSSLCCSALSVHFHSSQLSQLRACEVILIMEINNAITASLNIFPPSIDKDEAEDEVMLMGLSFRKWH